MKEKILSALKTRYSNLGLSAETLEGVASQFAGFVKEESGIDSVVAGAEPMLKAIQSFADSRAATSRSEAERIKREFEEAKRKAEEEAAKKAGGDEMPAWAKALTDKLGTMEQNLQGFSEERKNQSLSQRLTSILAEKQIPESYSKAALIGRKFGDEAEVTALAEAISTQYEAFKQESANLGFSYTKPPQAGEPPKSDASDIAALIEKGTKEIVEQSKN